MKIALLTGGESSERDVALASAKNVEESISGAFAVEVFDFPQDLDAFVARRAEFAAAVPVFHGKGGEDGVVQGMLEMLNVPYIFSGVQAHAIGLNKHWTKQLAMQAGLKTPNFRSSNSHEDVAFERPCVIKPNDGGSSIGITIARSPSEFQDGLQQVKKLAESILIEDYVEGDEYTVAVIDEKGTSVALPVIKIIPKTDFFDFESKYNAELVEEICPAPIDDDLRGQLQAAGLRAHKLIGARHLSRSDFIVDASGVIWFLEINTIPGQTLESLVPKAIRASGRKVSDVFTGWIGEVML